MQRNFSLIVKYINTLQHKNIIAILIANCFLIIGSYLKITHPLVPLTMQTLAVCLVGVMFGARLAVLAVIIWFIEAALGLPVLASSHHGISVFWGPTAGYLFSFPLMAYCCGKAKEKKSDLYLLWVALLMHLICLTFGSFWLSSLFKLSFSAGLEKGFYPFILGALIKIILLLALVKTARVISSSYAKK